MSFGQVFSGKFQKDVTSEKYFCQLKINSDSSIFLIYYSNFCINNQEYSGDYQEYSGGIKKINDTLYEINAILAFWKTHGPGGYGLLTLVDRSNFVNVKTITLRYQDGYKITYDPNKSPVIASISDPVKTDNQQDFRYYYREITLDPKHFHFKDSMDNYEGMMVRFKTTPVDYDIGHKNPITGKHVIFRSLDCINEFYYGEIKQNFSMIVTRNKIKLVPDSSSIEAYPFYLTKNKT
jgi:hypothetical protein